MGTSILNIAKCVRLGVTGTGLVACVMAAVAFEIKPIGCRGANGRDVTADVLVFADKGTAPAFCDTKQRDAVIVDCRAEDYLTVQFASQPVHETISRRAYEKVYGRYLNRKNWASPFISGVVWNDDPDWLLRKALHGNGISKLKQFGALFERGKREPHDRSLLVRSHFGDLQFLHAMKAAGQTQAEAIGKLRNWVVGAHKVAIGAIDPSSALSDTELGQVIGPLWCNRRPCTVAQLFDRHQAFQVLNESPDKAAAAYKINVRWLAAGTVLHVIQDAHSAAHTSVKMDSRSLPIRELQTYDETNQQNHCESDMATIATKDSIEAAEKATINYMELHKRKAHPDEVLKLLDRLGLRAEEPAATALKP